MSSFEPVNIDSYLGRREDGRTSVTVWVLISADEWTVMAVATTSDRAKVIAERDAEEPLTWRLDRKGKFVNDKWEYEIRPFEVTE